MDGVGRFGAAFASLPIPKHLLDRLLADSAPVTYPRGSLIFERNSAPHFLFAIFQGLVKITHGADDGDRRALRLAGPGEIIGYAIGLGFNQRAGRVSEARAMTKCSVGLITRDQVIKLLCRLDREQLIRLVDELNRFWAGTVCSHICFMGLSYARRMEIILGDIAARMGVQDHTGTLLPLGLTQSDLAEMIGSSRSLAAQLITTLIKQRRLLLRGNQYILPRTVPNGRDLTAYDVFAQALPLRRYGAVERD